jgi:uncharacterized protein DUF4157
MEPDRVADAVMKMPELGVQRQVEQEEEEKETLQTKPLVNQITPLVQRQVEPEEEKEELQAKATSGHISESNPNLESHIQSLKGDGHPLSENDRAYFEPRFGADFSQVRMHTDTRAAESARAFTVGQDVVFGVRQYAPENIQTSSGRYSMGPSGQTRAAVLVHHVCIALQEYRLRYFLHQITLLRWRS